MYLYTDRKDRLAKMYLCKEIDRFMLERKEKSILSDAENNVRIGRNMKNLTVNGLFQHLLNIKKISDTTIGEKICQRLQ